MSETQQQYCGYPDNFEDLRRERSSEVLGSLEDGIAEMRRLNAESARAARQGLPRTSTSQLRAYAHIAGTAQGSVRRGEQTWPRGAFGPGAGR